MNHPSCLLVIDDDHDILLSLQDALEMEGYHVATARTGREGLERLDSGLRPDLILLDLMMPDVSGWAFRARQRADPALDAIPVVVVSGQGLSTHDVAELGVAGYLPKPLDLDSLLSTVARFAPPPAPPESAGLSSW
ncbi:response regulator [Hyalangium rubrum]|uniref:Response regulator n=1 Tax=Hyalangium rubrum TaxID=3103134 RepID=A0ABU5HEM3_9BACT|nr:response regulator [Hyalangium sp. s54d21]MDY7231919.1 response regulator [Hyalangium sp. s54d21]